MPTIDGAAAARTLLTYAPLAKHGFCLLYVWLAMKAHGATSGTTYPTALSAWNATTRRHADKNPPAGAAVWLGRRHSDGNMAGDVCISVGGGRVACTDYPGWGQVGTCTIDQRIAQTGRTYLGWTEDFLGNTTVSVGSPAGGGGGGALIVDGDWGPATTSKLQSVLGVTVDGQLGPQTISALQGRLGVGVDGQMGPQTISALQAKVGATVDGQLGPNTIRALQTYLNGGGTFSAAPAPAPSGQLTVDGQWGQATTSAFQKSLNVTADGELGPITWKAFQTAVGITVDGIPGPQTYKALQMNVGATVDGALGPETVKKLQEHLNAGKGWTKVTLPTEPVSAPAVPRTPVYPDAIRGWTVPLSSDRAAGSVINRLIIHHTTNTGDEEPYFKTKNDRSSCPTWYVKANGDVIEMIAPEKRPSATGSANTYSVAIETQNTSGSPSWGISQDSHETIARIAAWLSKQTKFGAFTVDIKLDRTHIIGHNEAGVNATACPGPSMNLDGIVARAVELAAAPDPDPDPDPVETVTLTREAFDKIRANLTAALEALGGAS